MDHNRVIVHIDIDCFYAQVEMIRNPSLRDKPLGIQQKNIIVTCNYEARRRGVTKLMYLVEANKKCPDLVIVRGEDLTHYRQMSYQISEYIQRYSPVVERLGFDENYVDVTEMVKSRIKSGSVKKEFIGHIYDDRDNPHDSLFNSPCMCGCELQLQVGSQIAADIREGLEHDLNITCCAGIAPNKLLAKLVGSLHKPSQQTSLLSHMACQLMSSLSGVRAIPGIGSRTTKRLNALGIHSVYDLRQTQLSLLEQEFGPATANVLLKLAVGIDDTPVVTFGLPQTLSDEDSFKCCNDISDAQSRMVQLVGSLLERLRDDGRIPQTLRLTIRRTNYQRESRQCSVQQSIFTKFFKTGEAEATQQQLLPVLMALFFKMVKSGDPFHLTLINVCFAKLVKPSQNKLFAFFTPTPSPSKLKCQNHLGMEEAVDLDLEVTALPVKSDIVESKTVQTLILPTQDDHDEGIFSDGGLKMTDDTEKESCHIHQCNREPLENSSSTLISQLPPFQDIDSHSKRSPRKLNGNQDIVSSDKGVDKSVSNLDMFDSLKKLLPPHLDAKTILELPDCIQVEVLSFHGIHLECSPLGHRHFVASETGVSTRSKYSHCNTRKRLFSPRKKGQKRLGTGVEGSHGKQPRFAKTIGDTSSVELPKDNLSSSSIDGNMLNKNSDDDKINPVDEISPHSFLSHSRENSDQDERSQAGILYDTSCTNDSILKTKNVSIPHVVISDQINKESKSHLSGDKTSTFYGMQETPELEENPFLISVTNERVSETIVSSNESPSTIKGSNQEKPSICPKGIDPDVFSALPPNIRGEILAHAAMGSEHIFLNSAIPTPSPACDKKKKEQKTLLEFFSKT